jgi:DNA (cytosine-5)-methyltransferase 1
MINQSPYLDLRFNEKEIPFGEIEEIDNNRIPISEKEKEMWEKSDELGYYYKDNGKGNGERMFGFFYKMMKNRVSKTIIGGGCYALQDIPYKLNKNEICKISSFPSDYNFLNQNVYTICGMSVPPIMIANIADRIYDKWLKYIGQSIHIY